VPDKSVENDLVLIEPLSIGVYAAQSVGDMSGMDIGILGCGPIGLSVLHACKDLAQSTFFVTDKLDYRLRMAQRFGANWTGNPEKSDVDTLILNQIPYGLDLVFECCGKQDALDQAIDLLKPGGTLAIVGIPQGDTILFNISKFRRKEITVKNIRRQNECMEETIDLFIKNRKQLSSMITHRFSLEETQTAFDLVEGYKDGVVKAVIDFQV
jgi:L-iditol 2-dehydrogenase